MKKFAAIASAFMLPSLAFAQVSSNENAFDLIDSFIDAIVPIIFALAILFFLFQLAMFLLNTGEKKDDAKTGMIWGIIILVVMFSIGGIIALLQGTIFTDGNQGTITAPPINTTDFTVNGRN